jgi:hypothetical protein
MWVVFDDSPLRGATPLRFYDHGRWDVRLLSARGEVICVGFNLGEHPQVLARPGRLTTATIAGWANSMHRMGYDHVLLELKPGQAQVTSLSDAAKLMTSCTGQAPLGEPALVVELVKTK